jgi:hypothetical protein
MSLAATKASGSTNVITFAFDVFEPYSMGFFIHSLQAAAISAGYPNYNGTPYLLKLELSDNKFEKLLSKNEFSFAIEAYRDLITSKILEVNIFQVLESEIKFSILSNNFRTYSG